MADFYRMSHGRDLPAFDVTITADRARELYDEAKADPDADLDGDLETGFHYWDVPDGIKLVRFHITPLP